MGGSVIPGIRMDTPGLMTFPLMITAPMYTLSGPTFGGTNVSSGDAAGGGTDVAGAVAATAPVTGPARPSTLIDAAAADIVRSGVLTRRIRETR
jgi:hypothetical protein